jgi:RNA polymerase sigma-70 factor (ECF subfamily)
MPTTPLGTVLNRLCRPLLGQGGTNSTDGELLERFVSRRDEAAFEALLCRHGPMVLAVCRRVLRNEADAEDAFQATFLVLVKKAASVRPRGLVGNWLYGVAHTTALKARAMNTKRAAKEREAGRPKQEVTAGTREQLHSLLDEGLKALPDKYRAPIVLCELEGKSIKEAARHLGCPTGTVGTRLARGRTLLARRLSRAGLTLSGGVIATALAQCAPTRAVPPLLMSSTAQAAALVTAGQAPAAAASAKVAALTERAVEALLLAKLKIVTGLLLAVAGVAIGLGVFAHQASAQKRDRSESTRPAADHPVLPSNEAGLIRSGHTDPVTSVAFATDGKPPASGSHDETVRLGNDPPPHKPEVPTPPKPAPLQAAPATEGAAKDDAERLQGTWSRVAIAHGAKRLAEDPEDTLTYSGNRFTVKEHGVVTLAGTFEIIDAAGEAKQVDLICTEGHLKGKRLRAIYRLDGDRLETCTDDGTDNRPTEFSGDAGFYRKTKRKKP